MPRVSVKRARMPRPTKRRATTPEPLGVEIAQIDDVDGHGGKLACQPVRRAGIRDLANVSVVDRPAA